MEQRYKLTIFSKNIYQEVELLPESEKLKIGTTLSCDVRLRKDLFFCEFEIALVKNNESWVIQTTENIYLDFGGSQKKLSKPLEHGEQFCVRYSESDAELFYGRFFVDFDYENKQYDRLIDISQMKNVVIGTEQNAGIQLQGEYVYDDHMDIKREGSKLIICNIRSQYGVFLNGKRIETNTELKDYDFFSIANFSFYYKEGKLYTDKKSSIVIHGLQFRNQSDGGTALEYPQFHRNARIKVKLDEEEIPLLAPKEKPQKPKSNLVLKLLPALSMIVLTVVLRGMMGSTNLSFVLFSVCSMSIGAIVSVFTIMNEKKEYKEEIEKRDTGYRSYIDTKREEITQARTEEVSVLNQIYVPYEKTSADVMQFSGDLFDRIPEDEDFLDARIGIGNIDAVRKIEYKKQETYEADEDELVDLPVQLSENYKQVQNAPVVVHLKEANVVGVVGSQTSLYEMLKVLFFDICARQYYHDIKTFLMIPSNEVKKYQWAKWFRHLENEEIGVRNIVCDEESKNTILEYLYAELNRREDSKEKTHSPHFVVFVMDDYGINQHPVSKYIEKASELGCTFVFLEEKKEYVPVGCSQLIQLNEGNVGKLLLTEDRTSVTEFAYQPIPDRDMLRIAHRLAPVYCEEVSLEGALTKNITLYQLLGILSEEDLDLKARWSFSDVTKSMAAPLGVRSGNEIVYLNIHDDEKAHGPHGLVAGTTGSGKSELLMTYILAMATIYSPYEVAFLIIDFKGGGMGNQFKDLPHTLGVITDIDGKEINRSLISIKAELDRRKRLFAEIDVDHIDKYIRAYQKGKASTPLPHLIIIVDEFAELKAQYGDFMAELNSAARVGRSLGVHLILATQKPQGQVDPQIDSNSKFRLCLKVQTPEDSREVIKTPLAAEIKEAGRAYLMVGNNEIFELFQSAYSGAPAGLEAVSNQKEFQVSAVDFSGRRKVIYQKKHRKPMDGEEVLSQKEAITNLVIQYCKKNHIAKLPDICKPPLPTVMQYVKAGEKSSVSVLVNLGLYDNPAQQKQENYLVDLSACHMLIVGALQTGKTNVLQLLIRDVAEKYTPEEVNIYVIDYSSMVLANFQNFPHVGGVVCPNEDEKLNNLFKLLTSEIEQRKQKLKSVGVSSYTAYKEAGKMDIPLILLLIDNFTALKELNLNDNPVLLSILREGLSVGISVIIANGSTKGMEHRYLSSFACRIGMHHNNSDEYGNLFGAYKMTVDPIPGRCIVTVDKTNLDCQLYQSFEGEKEFQRIEKIKEFVEEIKSRYPNQKANLIPEIPEFLMEKEIQAQYASYFSPYHMILGFDYDTLMPQKMALSGLNLIISGTPKSGKGNFVKYMISSIEANLDAAPAQVVIFDKATVKKYAETAQKYRCVTNYELSSEHMGSLCKEWKAELEARKKLVLEHHGDMSVLDEKPLLMMICEDSSKEMLNDFDEGILELLAYKFSFVVSNAENEELSPMRSAKLYRAKNAGANFLLLGAFSASNIVNSFIKISMAERRERLSVETTVGDAFYVEAVDQTKVYRLKTIRHTD